MNTPSRRPDAKGASTRTCVGCGVRDERSAQDLVRLVVLGGEVAFDLAGGAFGRGAHVHARPDCLARAPRGIARAFRRDPGLDARELGERLVRACDVRMTGLLLAARRVRAVAVGTDATFEAMRRAEADVEGGDLLVILATDAGSVATSVEVQRAVAAGRAIAWGTKNDLGALLDAQAVAICAVRHGAIAAELKRARAAAAAGADTMRAKAPVAAAAPGSEARSAQSSKDRGAECSKRPEAQ
ncbi:MAG: YlxR family protein [Polyangiaceae bacterium]|nr:YlxR family protein [Polyangiaceae bacterium]